MYPSYSGFKIPVSLPQTIAVGFVAILLSLSVFSADSHTGGLTPDEAISLQAPTKPATTGANSAESATPYQAPAQLVDLLSVGDPQTYKLAINLSNSDPEVRKKAKQSLIKMLEPVKLYFKTHSEVIVINHINQTFPFDVQKILFDHAFYHSVMSNNFKYARSSALLILKKLGQYGAIDPQVELMLLEKALNGYVKGDTKSAIAILNSIQSLHEDTQKSAISALLKPDIGTNFATRNTIEKIMINTRLTFNTESLLADHFYHPIGVIQTTVHLILNSSTSLYSGTLEKLAHSLFNPAIQGDQEKATTLLIKNHKSITGEVYKILVHHLKDHGIGMHIVDMAVRILIKGAGNLSSEVQKELAVLFRLNYHGRYFIFGKILERVPHLHSSAKEELHYFIQDTTHPEQRKIAMRLLDLKKPGIWARCVRAFDSFVY